MKSIQLLLNATALGLVLMNAPSPVHAQRVEVSKLDVLRTAERHDSYLRIGLADRVVEGRVAVVNDTAIRISDSELTIDAIRAIERRHRSIKAPVIGGLIGAGLAAALIAAATPGCGDAVCPNWKTYLIGVSATAGLGAFTAALIAKPHEEWREVWPSHE